jgi:hypothetical protein
LDIQIVTAQADSRCTLNSQRKVGRAFLPDPEALEGQPGMADLPRLPEQLLRIFEKPDGACEITGPD